jgi:hypothetical protein
MAQTIINVGTTPNDGSGDAIRQAGIHINNNFTEIFALPPVLSDIRFTGNVISTQSSNTDIEVKASGAGVVQLGAGIKINDNNIISIRSNDDVRFIPNGTGGVSISGIKVAGNNIYSVRSNDDIRFSPSGTGKVVFGAIKIDGTTLSSDDSATININDNLIVDGTAVIEGASTLAALVAETTLAVTTAATTLSSTLSVAGATTLTTTNIDNLTIQDANISSASNADIYITPGGTGDVVLSSLRVNGTTLDSSDSTKVTIAEAVDVTGALVAKTSISIAGDGATVTGILDEDAMGSDSNVKLATQQSIKAYVDSKVTAMDLDFQGDSGGALSIDLNSESLTFAGTGGITTAGSSNTMTVNLNTMTGLSTLGMGSLTFAGNDITSSSNANINLTAGGTGTINMTSLTIDSSIKLFDNKIQTIQSNADIILSASGTGTVTVANIDLNQGTVDNVVIGATTPVAGTFTTLVFNPTNTGTLSSTGVTITDNIVTSSQSNDNLELKANGSGYVSINAFQFPNADGGTGQLLSTNASKVLTWVTSPILLGSSDIQDAKVEIGFSSETDLTANTAIVKHESIVGGSASTINKFTQTKYDSAWYLALTRMLSQDSSVEYSVAKYSLLQGTSDGSTYGAFVSHSSEARTGDLEAFDGSTRTGRDDHIEISADISGTNVRILGQGGVFADGSTRSSVNALTAYRIGLGDDDSSKSEGKATTVVHADLDSASAAIDTWAHASYRGAKYFISVNNTTTNEISNIECIVVHNGTNAFISSYNELESGNNSQITLAADINGSNVRLLGSNGSAGTCRITMYRVLLADDESDSSGTYINVIGATTVTNTAKTTIDANTFRGDSNPDMSTQKVISSFANTAYDSTWYHAITKDTTNTEWTMNKWSLVHGTTSDGSTKDAFITDSSDVRTSFFPLTIVDADISGSTVQLKATASDDGSSTIQNAITYYGIGLGSSTSTATSGKISTHAGVTIGGNNETRIDLVTASGTTTTMTATERTVASFTAGSFDSHWYYVVTKDVTGTSIETQKISLMHNASTAFITSSGIVRTDPADQHPTFDADITSGTDSTSTVRLRATDSDGSSVTPSNTMAYYRIGLGDDDSTGYVSAETDEASIQKTAATTIGSTIVDLDTWTASSSAAAKYFISVKNTSTGEVGNMEALLTHNDSDSFVSVYNESYSGSNSLLTVTADYDSGNCRLRGSATAGSSTRVNLYRILLGDTESADTKTNTRTVANVTVSSAVTAIDTFTDGNTGTESGYDACHYIVTAQRGSVKFVTEATVVTDGTNAYISQHGDVSTKSTPMLELSAAHDGSSTVTVSASSTDGASTLVNAWRINLKAPTSQVETVDSWAHGSNRGAKYYISVDDETNGYMTNLEALVTHNGTDAFISTYNEHSTNVSLATFTASLSGSNVTLTATSTNPDTKIRFYKIMLADNESNATGTDANVIGAVTVSSTATAIDTFVDTSYTGAHYIIVGYNSGESGTPASICEATVLTDGTGAYVSQGPYVSTKGTSQLSLTAAHDGSSTVTLSALSTSGGSTTVNAYRIHMLRGDGTAYTELDEFASADYQGAHYVIVGKNASSESQILELSAVTDGVGAYILETGASISTHSTTGPLMNFTAVYDESKLKLRAENVQENTSTIVNAWRVHLSRGDGDTTGIKVLDTFDATVYRSAKYTISISDASNGRYETLDLNLTHNGSTCFISTFGRVNTYSADLVTFSASIVSNTVELKGQISNTEVHEVIVVRRVIAV